MRKLFFLGLVSMLVVLFSGCGQTLHSPNSSFVRHASHSSVSLVYYNATSDTWKPFCSGSFISDREILTAAHCVRGVAEHLETTTDHLPIHYILDYEVKSVGEEPYAIHLAQSKISNDDYDLAILEVLAPKLPDHDSLKVSEELPKQGDGVAAIGTPRGLYFSYMEGTISAVRPAEFVELSGTALQVDISSYFGSSGGPLINSNGEVIGVCSRLTGVPHEIVFVSVNKETLAKIKKE